MNGFAIKINSKNTGLKVENSKNCKIIRNKEGFIIIFKKVKNNRKINIELAKEIVKAKNGRIENKGN